MRSVNRHSFFWTMAFATPPNPVRHHGCLNAMPPPEKSDLTALLTLHQMGVITTEELRERALAYRPPTQPPEHVSKFFLWNESVKTKRTHHHPFLITTKTKGLTKSKNEHDPISHQLNAARFAILLEIQLDNGFLPNAKIQPVFCGNQVRVARKFYANSCSIVRLWTR